MTKNVYGDRESRLRPLRLRPSFRLYRQRVRETECILCHFLIKRGLALRHPFNDSRQLSRALRLVLVFSPGSRRLYEDCYRERACACAIVSFVRTSKLERYSYPHFKDNEHRDKASGLDDIGTLSFPPWNQSAPAVDPSLTNSLESGETRVRRKRYHRLALRSGGSTPGHVEKSTSEVPLSTLVTFIQL